MKRLRLRVVGLDAARRTEHSAVGQGRSARLAGLPLRPAAEEVANRHSVKPISQVICLLTGRVAIGLRRQYVCGRRAGGGGPEKEGQSVGPILIAACAQGTQEECEFRSAHRGGRGCQPAFSPIRHRSQDRLESSPARCQAIAHAYWRAGVDEPLHDALGLQLSQPLGENAVADSRDPREQLVETGRPRKQRFDHCPGPALAYQLNRALKGGAVVETPSDHGDRFYATSEVLERPRLRFSTRNFSVSDFWVWDS